MRGCVVWTAACALAELGVERADSSLVEAASPRMQASLTRRPYLPGDDGGLLVAVAGVPGAVVRLTHGGAELLRGNAGPDVSLLPFPTSQLPAEADLVLTLEGSDEPPRTLHFARAARPTQGSFSQVDFSRRGLLLNGEPFVIVGFYVGDSNAVRHDAEKWNDTYVKGPDEAEKILQEIETYHENGLTSMMLYHLYDLPDDVQQRIMDKCAELKVYMMYPIHMLLRDVVSGDGGAWARVEAIVRRWRGHPGLLGWYACDDCTTTWIKAQQEHGTQPVDGIYRRIKALDPSHVVIGAIETTEFDVFTGPSEYTRGVSLDVLMYENYVSRPQHDNSAHLRDGRMTFEAVVNCPGPYQLTAKHDPHFLNDPAQEAQIVYSLSWQSVLSARAPHQLYFRRKFISAEMLAAVARYAREVRTTFAQFTLVPEPARHLDVAVGHGFTAALLPGGSPSGSCAMLVVTNLQGQEGRFQAAFAHPVVKTATPLLVGEDAHTLALPVMPAYQGDAQRLSDTLSPWQTRQYQVGACEPSVAAGAKSLSAAYQPAKSLAADPSPALGSAPQTRKHTAEAQVPFTPFARNGRWAFSAVGSAVACSMLVATALWCCWASMREARMWKAVRRRFVGQETEPLLRERPSWNGNLANGAPPASNAHP